MGKIVLVLGGARSGKSEFALKEASRLDGAKAFLATAQPFDEEMRVRIKNHKAERGSDWTTFEEPLDLSRVIGSIGTSYAVIVLDCLTLWASNVMLAGHDFSQEVERFLVELARNRTVPIIIVSNEVGLGLVPETELGRAYRDNLGMLNRRVAAIASSVYFMVAGIPLAVKEIAS